MIPELTLNTDNRLPLYVQLKEGLQRALQEGFWPQEQALPSERELSEQLQISRATVRQAVQELEHEGWLVRRQGRGTFASQPKVEQPLVMISSFTENMERAGLKAESRLLSASLEPATAQVAKALKLGPSGVVAVIARLRLGGGEPLMLERSHLNYALTPGLLEHELSGSLYELLHQTYRLVFAAGVERIEAIAAEPWLAKALGIRRGEPVLYTERSVTTDSGVGLEFTQRYGRADKCSFRVQLVGDNAQIAIKEEGVRLVLSRAEGRKEEG
jgi:GntR family transcriptional regulator